MIDPSVDYRRLDWPAVTPAGSLPEADLDVRTCDQHPCIEVAICRKGHTPRYE